jgi:spore germination protein GerM
MTVRRSVIRVAVVVAVILLTAWWLLRPTRATVSVYFVRADGTRSTLQDVPRTVGERGAEAMLAAAIRALLAGPSAQERTSGLTTAIPAGTKLRSLRIDNTIVLLDLSTEIESGGGSAIMLARFWQLVYTATQFPHAPQVRILVDGVAKSALGGEGVLIDRPVSRPAALPEF